VTNVRFVPDVPVPLADGLTSRADLYLPEDDLRHPVLLARSPYGKVLTNKELDLLNPLRAARRGYVVVIQDCRGRLSGEGDFTPFVDEGRDGVAAVDWCANQPWSDGRVGLWGMSYFGATQLLAAAEAPPALVAMAPAITASRYDEGWFFEGGVLRQAFAQSWMAILAIETVRRRNGAGRQSVEAVAADTRDLARSVEQPFGPDQEEVAPFYSAMIANRGNPTWWDAFAVNTRYGQVEVPGLHLTCWYDIFLEGTLENYVGLRDGGANEAARSGQKLIVGPGGHGVFQRYFGDQDYGPMAATVDIPALHYRFFDEHFGLEKRPRTGVDQPVTLFLLGLNRWAGFAQWPPVSVAHELFLGGLAPNSRRGDGGLRETPPPASSEHRFLFDPERPVPTQGGALLGMGAGPRPGPFDQVRIEERDDVLVYTSDPLKTDWAVVGAVAAELEVDSTAEVLDICVKLVDVDPAGTAINIADSVTRSSVSGRHILKVRVGSVGVVFRAGHRIRIQVAGSNFPRLERSPGQAAIHSVFTGQSRLTLPVVDIGA
jgi:uncharacterized protein